MLKIAGRYARLFGGRDQPDTRPLPDMQEDLPVDDASVNSGLPEPEPDAEREERLNALTRTAANLGFEVVDIAAFLQSLRDTSEGQLAQLQETRVNTDAVLSANTSVRDGIRDVVENTAQTASEMDAAIDVVRQSADASRDLANWVASVPHEIEQVSQALTEVVAKTERIEDIAFQISLLSLNAGIEASRAGEAGAGFAIIAQTVNQLSESTNSSAEDIRQGVARLEDSVRALSQQAARSRDSADTVIDAGQRTDRSLADMAERMRTLAGQARSISELTGRVDQANAALTPSIGELDQSVRATSDQVSCALARADALVDKTEAMVQMAATLGGEVEDATFIERVRDDAATLSDLLEAAVDDGRITLSDLFSRSYSPIANTNPQQVMAPFTRLTDKLFPDIQEAALTLSDKVVFCAAVNLDGYLPTHNRKFSKPQGRDVTWNTANCRNRRVFNDRVGLKAGRNREPFLLQVYRRDMGGGTFKMMKDVSSPIVVRGRHWGGLRLAYLA